MAAGVLLEDGEPAHRVFLQELRFAVVPGHDVHRLEGDAEPLLGEIDAQLLRVRRADEIVDLHAWVLPWLRRERLVSMANTRPATSRERGASARLRPAGVRREIVEERALLVGHEPGHAAPRELLAHAPGLHLPHLERHAAGRVETVAAHTALAEHARPGRVRLGQRRATAGRGRQGA